MLTEDEIQKIRIIEAVITEFSKQGAKFTMDGVAASLKMSKKTLYLYFTDKESLLLAAVSWAFAQIKESEQAIVSDPSLSLTDKIRRLIIVLPDFLKQMDYSKFPELKKRYPKVYAQVEKHLESQWEQTFSLMTQAMEEGLLKKISYPVFESIVTGAMESFLTKSLLREANITYQQAMEEMIEILMYGIATGGC